MTPNRKPDGTITTDWNEYIDAWKNEIILPLENALNVECYGWDPDVALFDRETQTSVTLPLWFAKRIVGVIKGVGS